MKKKEAAKDEDGLIETDGWEEEQHSKKLFDRNTVFLVIIFSLTFFILGNATGFFLLDRANKSMYTDPDFFITSSDTVSNLQTKEYNDVSDGQQTALSEAETADSAISDVLSENAKASDNDGSGNTQKNAAKSGSNETLQSPVKTAATPLGEKLRKINQTDQWCMSRRRERNIIFWHPAAGIMLMKPPLKRPFRKAKHPARNALSNVAKL